MTFNKKDALTLIVRIIIGVVFIITGWMKVTSMADTVGFFGTIGLPAIVAYLVSYGELLGGIALILGIWMNWAAMGLGIIMLGAIYFSREGGFQMYALPMLVLSNLLALLALGAGSYALPAERWVKQWRAKSATPTTV